MTWVSKWFKTSEVACDRPASRCDCSEETVHPAVLEIADAARTELGVGLAVFSGVRCPEKNQQCGGRPSSLHLPKDGVGHALDLSYARRSLRSHQNMLRLYILLESLSRQHGGCGIGLFGTFIHIDVRPKVGMKAARWEEKFPWPRLS